MAQHPASHTQRSATRCVARILHYLVMLAGVVAATALELVPEEPHQQPSVVVDICGENSGRYGAALGTTGGQATSTSRTDRLPRSI
jgi:hypothetical protein